MRTWLISLWDRLRESYWFIPSLMSLGALALAIMMPQFDHYVSESVERNLQWIQTTPASARATLSAIAGALVTVTSVALSMTFVGLTLTASQFGPRLLRNFMGDRVTHLAVGMLLGTSLYCLLVMRSVRDIGDRSVPHLSVVLGVILAVMSLAAMILLLDHLATSIQATTVVRQVAQELDESITRLFPEAIGSSPEQDSGTWLERVREQTQTSTVAVESTQEGYLQAVDPAGLMELTREADITLRLHYRPGDFLTQGTVLAKAWPRENCGDDLARRVNGCFIVGVRRSPRQDVECAVNELVEVAIRALSPGINDPFTAMNCIDRLSASLCRLARREIPAPFRFDPDDRLRLVTQTITFAGVLNASFDQIRQYGRSSAAVTIRLLERLMVVAEFSRRESDQEAILRQAQLVFQGRSALPEAADRADVEGRYLAVLEALGVAPLPSSDQQPSEDGSPHRSDA